MLENTNENIINDNEIEELNTVKENTSINQVLPIKASSHSEKKASNELADDKNELPIEHTIQHLEAIIGNYKALNTKIHTNKNKIADLQKKTIKIKERKIRIEEQVNKSENGSTEPLPSKTNTINDSNLVKEITDNKYFIKNKTCNNIKKNVEKIQNNIASNTKKSASYIEPLYLSFKLLKTHISYTQSLENTVAAFDVQKELELQQDDANELIKMLVDHFDAIKDYQPLAETDDKAIENTSKNQQSKESSHKKPANEAKSSPQH